MRPIADYRHGLTCTGTLAARETWRLCYAARKGTFAEDCLCWGWAGGYVLLRHWKHHKVFPTQTSGWEFPENYPRVTLKRVVIQGERVVINRTSKKRDTKPMITA